ncbi:MAG: hypothetical protein RLY71_4274 [Pseudomonadota bacterium]
MTDSTAPAPAGLELYCYYRVPAAAATAALAEWHAAQTSLRAALPGLETRLLKRPDTGQAHHGEQTWMEIHRHPAGLSTAQIEWLQTRLADLPSQRSGARHLEWFEPLA